MYFGIARGAASAKNSAPHKSGIFICDVELMLFGNFDSVVHASLSGRAVILPRSESEGARNARSA